MPRSIADVLAHADELAARFETAEPSESLTYGDALAKLRTAVLARAAAERGVLAAVAAARQEGHSWNAIGAMMGTTGEAARQRYRHAEAAPSPKPADDERWRILVEAGFTRQEIEDFAGALQFGAVLAEAGHVGPVAEIRWTTEKIEAFGNFLASFGFSQEPPPGYAGGPQIRVQATDMDPLPFAEETADESHEARC